MKWTVDFELSSVNIEPHPESHVTLMAMIVHAHQQHNRRPVVNKTEGR